MGSEKPSAIFDDEFMDFLNSSDMEVQEMDNLYDSKTLLELLQTEMASEEKLRKVQSLVVQYLPKLKVEEVENKLLQYLMPFLENVVLNIFEELELKANSNQQRSNEVLLYVKQQLQACVNVHELLQTLLSVLLKNEKVELVYITSLPQATVQILLATFNHCKKSNKLYKVYYEELKEIVALFKESQNVHMKFLKLLEHSLDVNESDDQQLVLIVNVLETLGAIGVTLNNLNVKALADNWKCYVAVAQKYSKTFAKISFSFEAALDFLFLEVIKNLSSLKTVDQKGAQTLLKLSNFFFRLATRLCEIFWSTLGSYNQKLFVFLTELYMFSQPILMLQGCCRDLTAQVNRIIFSQCNSFLDKLLVEPKFYTVCKLDKDVNYTGFLVYLLDVLKKLPILREARCLTGCEVHIMITFLFAAVKECYSQMFWSVQITQTESLYEALLHSSTLAILSLDQDNYNVVQNILLTNCLQTAPWPSLLASDIWCSVLRKHPKLTYETLTSLIESSSSLLQSYVFEMRPEVVFLEHLLSRLYDITSNFQKCSLLRNYPLHLYVHVWRVFGLENFPQNEFYRLESFLITLIEKIDEFVEGKATTTSLIFLCNSFELFSSFPRDTKCDVKHFKFSLLKLWNFNVAAQSKSCIVFNRIVYSLCGVTKNFSCDLDGAELLLIIAKLNELVKDGFDVKVQALEMLSSLSTKSFSSCHQRVDDLVNLYRALLLDKSVVIRQEALEVFVAFLQATPHAEIAQIAVKNNPRLQSAVTNFINGSVTAVSSMSSEEYFEAQKSYKFEHSCKELRVVAKQRSWSDDESITSVVKRIKSDVDLLSTLCAKDGRTQSDTTPVFNMLSQHFNLKF